MSGVGDFGKAKAGDGVGYLPPTPQTWRGYGDEVPFHNCITGKFMVYHAGSQPA